MDAFKKHWGEFVRVTKKAAREAVRDYFAPLRWIMDAFKKRGRENVSIKRPVKADGTEIECGFGLFLRGDGHCVGDEEAIIKEAAACINLAPKLAEALREVANAYKGIGGSLPSWAINAGKIVAEWDAATSQCDPS